MKVEQMYSSTGNQVANQYIIYDGKGNTFFQSYDTIIVKLDKLVNVTLDKDKWDYSTTTGKYRNQFLGETIKETRNRIKSGEYKLEDLNK